MVILNLPKQYRNIINAEKIKQETFIKRVGTTIYK